MPILSCNNIQHLGVVEVMTTISSTDEYSSDIKQILIKRKIASEFLPITIYQKNVADVSDLTVEIEDALCRNNTEYEYKVEYRDENDVIINSETCNIVSFFNCLVLFDEDKVYTCPLNCSAINFNTIKPFVVNAPILSKKPSYYCNTMINYDEGTCQGTFVDIDDTGRNIEFIYKDNWKYRKKFKDWLTVGNAKVIKSVSGEMWLVGIKTDTISDSSIFSDAEIDGARLVEFGWVEIGDVDSEQDLYDNNLISLIDIDDDYWSA